MTAWAKSVTNFSPQEFACKCPRTFCSHYQMTQGNVDASLVSMLQTLRDACGVPLSINSGGRCIEHHAEITRDYKRTKTPRSGHIFKLGSLTVRAADVTCPQGTTMKIFAAKAKQAGFRRIGVYVPPHAKAPGFIHVDVLPGEMYWDLDTRGRYRYVRTLEELGIYGPIV